MFKLLIRMLDYLTAPFARREPESHIVGRRGEDAAYFYLRERGYTIVARNWRASGRRGELDLVGWDDGILCFIEVKTRTEKGIVAAEMAVDRDKQRELAAMAWLYRKKMPPETQYRFDVVSVYLGDSTEIELKKNAFRPFN